MPTVRVHVRPEDWNRPGWRKQFESDLVKTGWQVVSVEAPAPGREEYVYVLTLSPAAAESGPGSASDAS
jgi:hypothetical protein